LCQRSCAIPIERKINAHHLGVGAITSLSIRATDQLLVTSTRVLDIEPGFDGEVVVFGLSSYAERSGAQPEPSGVAVFTNLARII